MINNRKELEKSLNSNDVLTVRSFLENCILWDALYKKEIEEYIDELVDKKIDDTYIFEEDNGMDLSNFKNTKEDLDKLSVELMFNFSEKKYRKKLDITYEIYKQNNTKNSKLNSNENKGTSNKDAKLNSNNTKPVTVKKSKPSSNGNKTNDNKNNKSYVNNENKNIGKNYIYAVILGVGAIVTVAVLLKMRK